jgi:hypothetical protein
MLLLQITQLFQKNNIDPNLSVEVMAEMLMQLFVGMQVLTTEDINPQVQAFFDRMKVKAAEVLPKIVAERNKAS